MKFLALFLVIGLSLPVSAEEKSPSNLDGTWTASQLTYNGKDVLADGKVNFQFVFKGNEVTVLGNDKVKKEYARIRLQFDASVNPPQLDLTITGGAQKDAVIQCIYSTKKDELTICGRVLGRDRPAEFTAPSGSSVFLLVLKKE